MFNCYITRKAFTLIELLVVISIVSLLVAILLPALASARSASRSSQCLANIKSQMLAIQLYASDFGDYVPPYYIRRPSASWPGPKGYPSYHDAKLSDGILLGQYTQNETLANGSQTQFAYIREGSIWECPDRPVTWTGQMQSHYAGADTVFAKCDSILLWSEMWRISDILIPSKLIGTADAGSTSYHPGFSGTFNMATDEQIHAYGNYSTGSIYYVGNIRKRHHLRKTCNMGFFDGHVSNFANLNDEYVAGRLDIKRPNY